LGFEQSGPGARFPKVPETFRARIAIFSLSVFNNGEAYTLETSCMKGTSVHSKSMRIKQPFSHKVEDFVMAFRVQKLFGTFEKRAPGALLSTRKLYGPVKLFLVHL